MLNIVVGSKLPSSIMITRGCRVTVVLSRTKLNIIIQHHPQAMKREWINGAIVSSPYDGPKVTQVTHHIPPSANFYRIGMTCYAQAEFHQYL
jgi:hypothetical protein